MDTSKIGIGTVLMQGNHPICYISRALGARHHNLSVNEKELLAVVHAHAKFIICTDQKSLKFLLEQNITMPIQHMWLSKLMGYTFEIHYKQGKENIAADALSRVTGSQLPHLALSQIHNGFYDKLKQL